MRTPNGQSSQEEKSQAALQLFSEFISNFIDPDPGTNRQILSELLTVGFKHCPHPNDEEYSDTAGRLSEAVRSLVNGIIDNDLDDQIEYPGPGQAGSLKFNYSRLDKFLNTKGDLLELAKGFTMLHGGFADIMAQAIAQANFHDITFTIPEYSTLHLKSLIEMFEIIRELEEVKS